jgi:hypothetical protein
VFFRCFTYVVFTLLLLGTAAADHQTLRGRKLQTSICEMSATRDRALTSLTGRTTILPGGNTTRCGYSTINGSANPYYFQIQTQSSQLSSHHHPDVKLIPKLQDKSKGEQIMRCTDRMKNSPAAVETLLKALSAARQNPDTDKFRHIVL